MKNVTLITLLLITNFIFTQCKDSLGHDSLLNYGVPFIVNDVDTFMKYHDDSEYRIHTFYQNGDKHSLIIPNCYYEKIKYKTSFSEGVYIEGKN